MKLWKRILIILIAVAALGFFITYAILVFKGKALVIAKLQEATGKKVSIGAFNIYPPLKIGINDLNIESLLKADQASVSLSVLGLLAGKIILNQITVVSPVITWERGAKNPDETQTAEPPAETEGNNKGILLPLIKNISIKNGTFNFIDHNVGDTGIKITAREINLALRNAFVFPASLVTSLNLKGKIPWKEGQEEGRIDIQGWINFFKKDIQATLKIEGIDGVYLHPYYSSWVDIDKMRLEKAKLNFSSNIRGENNNVTAQCHLELTDLVRKASDGSESNGEKVASAVLGFFQAMNQGKVVLDFTIRSKLDRPEFGFGGIKMAYQDKPKKPRAGSFKFSDIISGVTNFFSNLQKPKK